MAIALALMTQLRAETSLPVLWVWMFLAGLGIGPTFSVFTVVVQNAVPVEKLGVATSNLTFFRQIGGSVGLAMVGTVFGTTFREQIPIQLRAQGTPEPFVQQFQALSESGAGGFDVGGVGDLGATLRAVLPPEAQPFVDQLVGAIEQAFSLAIASTFWLGVAAVVGAIFATAAIAELPLRGPSPDPVAGEPDDVVVATSASADGPMRRAPAAD